MAVSLSFAASAEDRVLRPKALDRRMQAKGYGIV